MSSIISKVKSFVSAHRLPVLAIATVLVAVLGLAIMAYATAPAGNPSPAKGSLSSLVLGKITIEFAKVSNGSETIPCTFTNSSWACYITRTQDGYNLTVTLTVNNFDLQPVLVYSFSRVVKGANCGSLLEEYTDAHPYTLGSNQTANIWITFELAKNCPGGTLIEINTTVY